MIEINTDHRLHSPAQTLLTGLHQVMTVEETTVESRAFFGNFSDKFVIGNLDPTALDHLVPELAHEANIRRLAREADVVDLAEDRRNLFHVLIILLGEAAWAGLCASS